MQNVSLEDYLGDPKTWGTQQQQQAQQPQTQDLESYLGQSLQGSQIPAAPKMPKKKELTAEQIIHPTSSALQPVSDAFFKYVVDPVNSWGGRLAEGASRGVAGLGNIPLNALDTLSGGNIPFRFKGMPKGTAPFVNPNQPGNQIAAFTGEMLPSLALGGATTAALRGGLAASQLPKATNFLSQVAGSAASGAGASPDNPLLGAAIGTAVPVGLAGVGKVFQGAKPVINFIKNAKKNPNDFVQNEANEIFNSLQTGAAPQSQSTLKTILTGGKVTPQTFAEKAAEQTGKLSNQTTGEFQSEQLMKNMGATKDWNQINATNNAQLKQIAQQQKDIAKQKYDLFHQELENAGFNKDVKTNYTPEELKKLTETPEFWKGDLEYQGKHVTLPNHGEDWGKINEIINLQSGRYKTAIGQDTIDAIKKFKLSPSPQVLQKTMSDVGARIRYLKDQINSGSRTGNKEDALEELENLHDTLSKGLENTLNDSGSESAIRAFNDAQQHYAQNVVPYKETPIIKDLFNRKKPNPINLVNTLTRDSEGMNTIRNHIMQNPKLRNSLLAQQLAKGATLVKPTAGGGFKYGRRPAEQLSFADMEDNYNAMPNVLKQMITPEYKNALEAIITKRNNIGNLSKYDIAKWAGGLGLGGVGAEELIRKLF